jgi:hypothetical protein
VCNAAAQAPRDGQWVALLKHATGVIADHEAAAGAPILFLPSGPLELCEPVPGFEGPAQRPPVAVDACMHALMQEGPSKALSQAGRSPLFLILAARHVRTIAHAIDGARWSFPANQRG